MRINASGTQGSGRINRIPDTAVSRPTTENAQATQHPSQTLTGRLISFFSQKGFTVSPSQIQALTAELTALGMKSSDIDSGIALRALVLHQNNIPLVAELLVENSAREQMLFQRLGLLREHVISLLSGKSVTGDIRSVFDVLINDIDSLAKSLEQSATKNAAVGSGAVEPLALLTFDGIPVPVRDLLQSSGLMLEWKLLAWYRSGKDPAVLSELVHQDVKGMVAAFLESLKTGDRKGYLKRKLASIEREAQELFDSISGKQISSILHNREDSRSLYLEIPFGGTHERSHSKIWAGGNKKAGAESVESESFDITFDVETSHIGRVFVTMNVEEKNVSLTISLQDEQSVTYAREMQSELVESLEARGFMIRSVTVGIMKKDEVRSKFTSSTSGVDITG